MDMKQREENAKECIAQAIAKRERVGNVVTNKKFASDDDNFRGMCARAGIDATRRQASKYRNHKGKAFKEKSLA